MKIKSLIRATEAAISAENDPKKLRDLQARLATFTATAAEMGDDGDEDDDDDDKKDPDGDGDDSAAEKHAKRAAKLKAKAKATEHRSKAAEHKQKAAEAEEAARKCEEEGGGEEERAEEAVTMGGSVAALTALIEARTGQKGDAALGTIMAQFAKLDNVSGIVDGLKADAEKTERASLLTRASKYVPKHLISALKTQSIAAVRAFVTEAEKGSPMVATDEGDLIKPKHTGNPGTEETLPQTTRDMIDQSVAFAPPGVDRAAFRDALVKAHTSSLTAQHVKNGGY